MRAWIKDALIKVTLVSGTAVVAHELRAGAAFEQTSAQPVALCWNTGVLRANQQRKTADARCTVADGARHVSRCCGRESVLLPVGLIDKGQKIEMTFKPEGVFWR